MIKKAVAMLTLTLMAISLGGCSKETNKSVYLDMIDNKDSSKKILFLSESQGADYPTTKGDYEFARLVKERTNGRIEINVVPNGGLGSEKDTLSQIKLGTVDFTRTSVAPLSTYSNIMSVLGLPYLYRDSNHMWSVVEGQIGKQALNDLEKAGMRGLAFYDSGARSFYNNKREIKTLADLQSLRIRVQESELMKSTISSLGATAIAMDSSQVLQALALGQVDGAENNPATYVSLNHLNVAKYYTFDEHTRAPDVMVASNIAMEKMSKEDQDIIKQAALDSVATQKKEWRDYESQMLSKMKEMGVKITELDQGEKEQFKAAVKPIYDKLPAEYQSIIKAIEETK